MDQQEINQFLAGTKMAVMATINRDALSPASLAQRSAPVPLPR